MIPLTTSEGDRTALPVWYAHAFVPGTRAGVGVGWCGLPPGLPPPGVKAGVTVGAVKETGGRVARGVGTGAGVWTRLPHAVIGRNRHAQMIRPKRSRRGVGGTARSPSRSSQLDEGEVLELRRTCPRRQRRNEQADSAGVG